MRNDPARETFAGKLKIPYQRAGRWYEDILIELGLFVRAPMEVRESDLFERLGLRMCPEPLPPSAHG